MQRFAFLMHSDIETKLPIYMCGAGHWESQETIIRTEGYPLFQWLFCTNGEGMLKLGHEEMSVKPGMGIYLLPNEPHEYRAIQEPWEIYWLNFKGEQALPMTLLAGLDRSGVYRMTNSELMIHHMKAALALALSEKPLVGLECSKLLYNLIIDMMKSITIRQQSIEQNYLRLQPVFDYMESHYTNKITLEDMAELLNVSTQHLCLLFRKIVNHRPVEYLNLLRINKSKELMLQEVDARIGEIARRVGFDTPGYYSTLFKKTEGMSPETFRRMNRLR
ncbi:AraC family transcriptional regulator [Paenibacillus roseipurpureus]|uniref:AraC family transcriptional regulator n=1 Tax=Paenibacillus roseopurpureus TaxID=2918901 RepID=A0AA96LR22_9BACL|nr:AraC family transcriptional regulator [Paenibacillus sp. MBLB1832]WNR45728.1 AraC family transcriptional regulator [Paenibacillus sp. MBLB1832]